MANRYTMSAMQPAAHPRIESTGDALRIEFPSADRRVLILAVSLVSLLVFYFLVSMFSDSRLSDRVLMASIFLYLWIRLNWDVARRYTVLLSEKGLAVRQQAFGIRWTKFYPLAEVHNLHLRYNPVRKSPKQWELIFDRYGLAQNVPIAMTLPDGQSIKTAIYNRFPRLAPAQS